MLQCLRLITTEQKRMRAGNQNLTVFTVILINGDSKSQINSALEINNKAARLCMNTGVKSELIHL